eukprot:9358463-Pyramimonas_sp.AAC.1
MEELLMRHLRDGGGTETAREGTFGVGRNGLDINKRSPHYPHNSALHKALAAGHCHQTDRTDRTDCTDCPARY